MLQLIVDWLVYSIFKIDPQSHAGRIVHFFIYDVIKIFLLLFVMISIIGFLRTFLPQNKVKYWLSGKKGFGNFFASLFGGTPTQITGPTGPMSVMIATMITAQLHARNVQTIEAGPELNSILTLVFFAVMLGGLIQILLGISGGGKLIKYIPYPVIAGFMNGVAMIIFFSQVKPLPISSFFTSL